MIYDYLYVFNRSLQPPGTVQLPILHELIKLLIKIPFYPKKSVYWNAHPVTSSKKVQAKADHGIHTSEILPRIQEPGKWHDRLQMRSGTDHLELSLLLKKSRVGYKLEYCYPVCNMTNISDIKRLNNVERHLIRIVNGHIASRCSSLWIEIDSRPCNA